MKHPLLSGFLALAAWASVATAQSVVYSNLPAPVSGGPNDPLPGNVFSYATNANLTPEVGDHIRLGGTDRGITKATLLLSSFNVSAGNPAITPPFAMDWVIRFYSVNNTGSVPVAGALLGSATATDLVPYRPTPFPRIPPGTGNYSGILFAFEFDFSSTPIRVDDEIIYTVGPRLFPFIPGQPESAVNVGLQINSSDTVIGTNVDHEVFWRRGNTPGDPLNPFPRDTSIGGSDSYSPLIQLSAIYLAPVPEPAAWSFAGAFALAAALVARRRRS